MLTEEIPPREVSCKLIEIFFLSHVSFGLSQSLWNYFGQDAQFLRISQIVLQKGDFFFTLMCCGGIL